MKLSIIIPMYNVELYIERCLKSCLKQDIPYEDYEIIVVNDGSPDGSLQIAERIASQNKNIKIISQQNGGLSDARNTGLAVAKGEYVWFIDSDDWIKENCLGKLLEQLYNDNLEALAICAANHIDGKDVRRFSFHNLSVMKGKDAMLQKKCVCCVPFTIYNREFLVKHKLLFYKGIFQEDNEFTYRAYYFLERLGFTNEILYFVYPNQNSITRSFNPKKSHDGIIVGNSLSKFMKNVDKDYFVIYHNEIGQVLNNALYDLLGAEKQITKVFSCDMYKNKHLFTHLIHSNILKYKVEGILFTMFPKKTFSIYKLMQKFNPNN